MLVTYGTKWLWDSKLHHLNMYRYFSLHCSKELEALYTKIFMIIYNTVQPYDIVGFEKSWYTIFFEKRWTPMVLK